MASNAQNNYQALIAPKGEGANKCPKGSICGKGSKGPKGDQGERGEKGSKGDKGETLIYCNFFLLQIDRTSFHNFSSKTTCISSV